MIYSSKLDERFPLAVVPTYSSRASGDFRSLDLPRQRYSWDDPEAVIDIQLLQAAGIPDLNYTARIRHVYLEGDSYLLVQHRPDPSHRFHPNI